MAAFGLRPILSICEGRDTQSTLKWLIKTARNMPVITTERQNMSNPHNERPGKGVMYQEENKESDKHPDFKGFIVLEMDYRAGEKLKLAAWMKPTSRGNKLISLSEDNFTKKKRAEHQPDREVQPTYVKHKRYDNDSDVPF